MSSINHQLGCLQVCVQKSASTSISDLFGLRRIETSPGKTVPNHLSAMQLRNLLGREHWARLTTFAFVRNPWERLVSWHSMIVNNPSHPGPFFRYVRETAPTFQDVLKCTESIPVTENGVTSWRSLTTNQVDYLVDDNGDDIVGFIGRFERLREDLACLIDRLNLAAATLGKLPHHRHKSSHRHYTDYYDVDLARRVGEVYARDIERFGYRFGE
jgi:hypothetical protein